MVWFSNFDDCMCSVVTIIAFMIIVVMPTLIYRFIEKNRLLLKTKKMESKYGAIYEEFNILKKDIGLYIYFNL